MAGIYSLLSAFAFTHTTHTHTNKKMQNLIVTLLLLSSLAMIVTCRGQTQPPTGPVQSDPTQEYLDSHNQARSEVGVGPLKWSPQLAKSASLTARLQRDKHNCSFADLSKSQYGGNQLYAGGLAVTPRGAVENWVAEKKNYDYEHNTCTDEGKRCGVYTQVVWRKTAEVGCAAAACRNEGTSLTVCFYNPPGNVIGERPY